MQDKIIGLLSIIGIFAILYLFKLISKFISSRAIVFSPVVMLLMIYLIERISHVFSILTNGNLDYILLFFSLLVSTVYVGFLFEKIAESSENNDTVSALIKIATMIFSSCLYFSLVYLMLYEIDHQAFKGDVGNDLLSQLVSFIYFSVVTFTTVGYGDINPISNSARLTVLLQIALSYITVVYAISSFTVFKDRFKIQSPFAINKKNEEADNPDI
ncbi:ion channel [Paenibacillus gorillae]|uniref:ion channel n=1 Tax=Paenibacillus gorillae TaxID=1243662 RepID=UPI0004AD854F|nr:ion channel [Paenibacillus gorillae]